MSYTVPADAEGGIANRNYAPARDMVSDAIAKGVDLRRVRIMTMHFSPMTVERIQGSATDTHTWLAGQYDGLSDAEVRNKIGIIPLTGSQGSAGSNPGSLEENFLPSEADQLRQWAEDTGLGMLSFWSLDRDASGSQIDHEQYAFSSVFNQLAN